MVLLFRRFRRSKTPEPVEEPAEELAPEEAPTEEEIPTEESADVASDVSEVGGPETATESVADAPSEPEPNLDTGAAGPLPVPAPTFPSGPVVAEPEGPPPPVTPAAPPPTPARQQMPMGGGPPPPLPASDESAGSPGEIRGLSSPPLTCFLCGTRLEEGRCPKCQMTWVE